MTDQFLLPDFNFGTSFTTSRYYVGFAMTNIFKRLAIVCRYIYLIRILSWVIFSLRVALNFRLAPDWVLEPSAFIKSSDMVFKSLQVDLTSRIFYKDDYWAGIIIQNK